MAKLVRYSTFLILLPALAQQPLELPQPQTDGGRPLMQVLKDRKTSREFSGESLPPQVLSNLLWAAFGINRPAEGRRTAPSAHNWQEIDIYVATAGGAYLFEPKTHSLKPVIADDIRKSTGTQAFVADAPVNLVYVADYTRMVDASESDRVSSSAADTGFIAQNVYLFCASEGLATVVRGGVDQSLPKLLKLRPDQHITLAQTVGYPKK